MRKVILILFSIFTLFLTSCSFGAGITGAGVVNITHNDEINKKILDSVKSLDDQVLDDLKNNNLDKIRDISSEGLKKLEESNKGEFDNIPKSIKDKSFEYQDRYYCEASKVGKTNFEINTKDSLYSIDLEVASKEMFISLIKSNSKSDDYILVLVYIKEQEQWKLNALNWGSYSFDGMNAVDLYEKAKSLDSKGYKIPAAIYLKLSDSVLTPIQYLHYKREKEVTDYINQMTQYFKSRNQYPEELKNYSNIKIYGLDAKYIDGSGIVPFIKYTTNTDLDNKDAIEKEANNINGDVTNLYQGMKENFNNIVYEAYSEPPIDPKKTYNCYRTPVKLN